MVHCAPAGRSYNVHTAEFAQHRLVNDSAYQRVRVSGILRGGWIEKVAYMPLLARIT